ncbi:MAG: gluconokinase [Akkermansiaceae bacterium]|jgi:gluconokinase|nr:gluconokinase [Luteolibacter sp.]
MKPNIFILMGVAAVGKTTLGRALANATGGLFLDGDDFHSAANREKMAAGMALTDEDQKNWLESIARLITDHSSDSTPTFIACSALKQSYRDILISANPSLAFLFLTADPETLRKRITTRYESGEHFMPPSLLDSQLATLEPHADALELDSSKPISELISLVKEKYPALA